MDNKELKELVRKTIQEIGGLEESDLITTNPNLWDNMKNKFQDNVNVLIQNIENDEYEDAQDIIGDTIGTLRFWRGKIKRGLEDRDIKYQKPFDKFKISEPNVIDEKD